MRTSLRKAIPEPLRLGENFSTIVSGAAAEFFDRQILPDAARAAKPGGNA
jgi:hypothetical protein